MRSNTSPTPPLSLSKRLALDLATFLRHWNVIVMAIAIIIAVKSNGELGHVLTGMLMIMSSAIVHAQVHRYIAHHVSPEEKQQVSPLETTFYIMAGIMVPLLSMALAMT